MHRAIGCAFVLGILSLAAAPAAEPWTDGDLPEREGLALWLDATRQNAAREARGLPPVIPEGPLSMWFDGSGADRHLTSPLQPSMPKLVFLADRPVVQFDGQDDFLATGQAALAAGELTCFVVAAPQSNVGFFRGLVSGGELGRNDYTTGLVIDQSGEGSVAFTKMNLEGAGFGGAVNLLKDGAPFGSWHTLEVVCAAGKNGVRLLVDGKPQGARDRLAGRIKLDELVVGGRIYSNTGEPPWVQGFFHGEIAEVLLYDRALGEEARQRVRDYLSKKYAPLLAGQLGGKTHRLTPVADPPPIQMLVPGFEVRELPVQLTNTNAVKYRADGKLVAQGYDGRVHILSDSDGDGLEDTAVPFWDQGGMRGPIGLALTPPNYPHGNGVFVPSKGKLSLLLDDDGDDRADREVIVAEGWREIEQSVDAVGVALDRDGYVYFGLGTPNFANGYLLDERGQAHFDIAGANGTIQRVSPDFKTRETWCTGTRFPVAMAFNREGDLFSTDQEGATWLANGNPFDELLHLQRGRHYGFPPRHPRHLPGVIDEPSTYDYRPQHQSTCGINFNEPVNGGPVFGPAWWQGDAIVSGESRGKLYRTKLVKTPAGYVAQTQLIACLSMLTIDACVSPQGDLVVTVHSGGPDWGTGPAGPGKLYKIRYADRERPQVVAAWAASPFEARIAFDRPLELAQLQNLAANTSIEWGAYVSAGDRFESFRPGYEVVLRQMGTPRYALPVRAAYVSPDRRTLVLATDEHPAAASYAVTLPGLGRPAADELPAGTLPQHAAVDLAYDLSGVEAEWHAPDGHVAWSGWLPHLDLAVAQALLATSAEHEALWPLLRSPGTLVLRGQLDLADLLRPAIQPGAKIDYQWPDEQVTLVFESSAPLKIDSAVGKRPLADKNQPGRTALALGVVGRTLQPIQIELPTGHAPARLEVAWFTQEDPRRLRPLPLRRVLLPWAKPAGEKVAPPEERALPPELAEGDWLRGREVFLSKDAQCSNCHTVRGKGGKIGPNLSNLIHRDYASVLRDVTQPSFAINPDYVNFNVLLADGRQFNGTLRSEHGRTIVGDKDGRETALEAEEIDSLTPTGLSIMPEGLPKQLGPERLRDLLTYLLLPHPPDLAPAKIVRNDFPPPRRRSEVDAVLAASEPLEVRSFRPLRIVLVYGNQDHGPNEHDYPEWQRRWMKLLSLAEGVRVTTAFDWPSPDDWSLADVLVWYNANPQWTAEKAPEFDAFLARGGGMVVLHYSTNGFAAPEALAERIGLAAQIGKTAYRHGPLDVSFVQPAEHPIVRGFEQVHFVDESYWKMIGDPAKINFLATCVEEGHSWPLLWTFERGRGRVFASIVGHYNWTHDDPLFRILVLRGIAWTAGEPIHRFHELATLGARVED